jgi:hypothetical protein
MDNSVDPCAAHLLRDRQTHRRLELAGRLQPVGRLPKGWHSYSASSSQRCQDSRNDEASVADSLLGRCLENFYYWCDGKVPPKLQQDPTSVHTCRNRHHCFAESYRRSQMTTTALWWEARFVHYLQSSGGSVSWKGTHPLMPCWYCW